MSCVRACARFECLVRSRSRSLGRHFPFSLFTPASFPFSLVGLSHHIRSHPIRSHHIRSHQITSDQIRSHHITSHHFTSHPIPSHHITSHRIGIASHRITSHRIASHHITSHQMCPGKGSKRFNEVQKVQKVQFKEVQRTANRKPRTRSKKKRWFRGEPEVRGSVTNRPSSVRPC